MLFLVMGFGWPVSSAGGLRPGGSGWKGSRLSAIALVGPPGRRARMANDFATVLIGTGRAPAWQVAFQSDIMRMRVARGRRQGEHELHKNRIGGLQLRHSKKAIRNSAEALDQVGQSVNFAPD